MKIIVTGSNGFVAGSVLAQAPDSWEIHGIARTEGNTPEPGVTYHFFDLLDHEKLRSLLYEIIPDAVIHTAALANIDFCETNQQLAEDVNVAVTAVLADACQKIGAKLVFCSTDTVFEGEKGNYSETDKPQGVNFYADTKIKAERIVITASQKNAVARLSLVMGLPVIGKGNSFLGDMIQKLRNGEQMNFPQNEIRTPVDVITLGAALLELAQNEFTGIIHLAGSTRINRYEMALQIASELNLPTGGIIPANSNSITGRAPRPNDASMDNSLAKQILKTPMLSLSEGLAMTLNFKTEK